MLFYFLNIYQKKKKKSMIGTFLHSQIPEYGQIFKGRKEFSYEI